MKLERRVEMWTLLTRHTSEINQRRPDGSPLYFWGGGTAARSSSRSSQEAGSSAGSRCVKTVT